MGPGKVRYRFLLIPIPVLGYFFLEVLGMVLTGKYLIER